MNNLNLIYLPEEIEIDRIGKLHVIRVRDLLDEDFSMDDYERFMLALGVSKNMYDGADQMADFLDFDIFGMINEKGEGQKFADNYIFTEPFDLTKALLKGLKVVFKGDEVTHLKNANIIRVARKDGTKLHINRLNYNLIRDHILETNMREKIKFSGQKGKKKKYSSKDMESRFKTYRKHKNNHIRKNRITLYHKIKFMRGLLGYGRREDILNMSMYDLNFEYNLATKKEKYAEVYDQYLAGVDPKKLDLTHWSIKK